MDETGYRESNTAKLVRERLLSAKLLQASSFPQKEAFYYIPEVQQFLELQCKLNH